MLLRSVTVGLLRPTNFKVIGSIPMTRNYSVYKPVSNRVLLNCPQFAVVSFPQLRHLSLSGHRFNTAPEVAKEVLEEVLDRVVPSIASIEPQAVVNTPTASKEELIFEIPEKPQIVPDASVTTATETAAGNELVFDIPEKPLPVDLPELLGEPAFDTLGLASWWPSGRMQYLMENVRIFLVRHFLSHLYLKLHIGMELEWWQTIAVTTLLMRFILFPVVVIAQRNMANMANHNPQMAVLQVKLTIFW